MAEINGEMISNYPEQNLTAEQKSEFKRIRLELQTYKGGNDSDHNKYAIIPKFDENGKKTTLFKKYERYETALKSTLKIINGADCLYVQKDYDYNEEINKNNS